MNGLPDGTCQAGGLSAGGSYNATIGSYDGSEHFFNGRIDDLSIFNYALTPAQIYQAAIDIPLATTGSSHWKFDETSGTTASDSSGNAHNATLLNFTGDDSQWVGGKVIGALDFDGVNDYVEISGDKGVLGSNSRTFTAWVKAATDEEGTIVHWGTGGPGGGNWMLHLNDTVGYGVVGALRLSVGGGRVTATTDLRDNAWHHVAVVLEDDGSPVPGELKFYVDGVLEVNGESDDTYTINTVADADLLIGAYAGGTVPFTGLIDDVHIYDYALNDYEISVLARIPGDFDGNRSIDMVDWKYIAERWLTTDCISPYCYQADMDESGDIGLEDVISFCQRWLQ